MGRNLRSRHRAQGLRKARAEPHCYLFGEAQDREGHWIPVSGGTTRAQTQVTVCPASPHKSPWTYNQDLAAFSDNSSSPSSQSEITLKEAKLETLWFPLHPCGNGLWLAAAQLHGQGLKLPLHHSSRAEVPPRAAI